ncbi:MAG: vWA domain-containing protein [Polyangiales bacterium]
MLKSSADAFLILSVLVVSTGCSRAPAPATGSQTSGATAGALASNPAMRTPLAPTPPPTPGPTLVPIDGGAVTVQNDDCNEVEIMFAPRIPSVFILVDRSSSMFERNLWEPLKAGVLAVLEPLSGEIRFGFASYTGAQGMTCPELSSVVPIAQGNFAAIKQAYDALAMPQFKGETPTSLALEEVTEVLLREPADNPKYILVVTDGEPDFCDDPNVTCARDAVVAAAQAAHAKGVGTFILSIGGQIDRAHLGDVANAGVGLPVQDRQMAVQYQCNGGKAAYSADSGNAPFFEPDVNDRSALVNTLSSVIGAARSCVFELQGTLKIDLNLADQGVVELDGMRLGYGTPDGFRMNTETQLELLGGACEQLKQPDAKHVLIDFPCEAIELL